MHQVLHQHFVHSNLVAHYIPENHSIAAMKQVHVMLHRILQEVLE